MPVQFRYLEDFAKDFARLRKRYRRIEDDLAALESEMQHKNVRGDFVRGYGLPIYKIRMTNRSARRGKRGGFRVIYYLQTSESILFIHIYSKSDMDDISASELWRRIDNLD